MVTPAAPVILPTEPPVTPQEHTLRRWVALWALVSLIPAVLYVHEAFTGPDDARAYAVNSIAKELSWIVLAVLVCSNVRKFGRLVTVVVIGHWVIVLSLIALVIGQRSASTFPDIEFLPTDWRLVAWLGLAAGAAALLMPLQVRARRSVLGLKYFYPLQFETLVALAEVALQRPRVPAEEIARKVDAYWASFPMRDRSRARLALLVLYVWPIFTLHAPFPLTDRDRRIEFIRKRYVEDMVAHRIWALWRPLLRTTIRFTLQMVSMGYYSDARTHVDTGFAPFADRSEPERRRRPDRPALDTLDPRRHAPRGAMEAEIVIVGTGAAGGVMAHELVKAGHDVLMLERGAYVDPATFTEQELDQYARLYSDGALQLSRDFRFQVLQGMCVGGSTVVNNGVCFALPPATLATWNADHAAGLPDTLDHAFACVGDLINVQTINPSAVGEGAQRVVGGIRELELDRRPNAFGPLQVNLEDCLGCGYCNIGCPYGRKLSMLDTVLPETQRDWPGRLRILPDCSVQRIEAGAPGADGRWRAGAMLAKVGADRRDLRVSAKTVIVAAGAVHSSRLLQDSGIGGDRVGEGLCANLGSFMTAEFRDRPPQGLAGVQQSHYLDLADEDFLLETWFNPVVSQALVMPGWLEQHEANMHRYDHMTCMGALVGTQPRRGNRVRKPGLLGGEFSFEPSTGELERIVAALKQAGEILFAAGATRVMPATFRYREYHAREELADLDAILADRDDLSLQTAHPQGGNAISADPALGVVDPTFRVHGYENLYVCDASVFPTATQVPPQLTVMALAHHAATHPQGLGAKRDVTSVPVA